MLRIDLGRVPRNCDGLSRRSFLQARRRRHGRPRPAATPPRRDRRQRPRKNTSVILIWLDGGPSHMDLYDMKPDAPAEYRGLWKPIRTRVPGIDITEMFPRQAKVTDKFSIVRSLHHDTGDHFAAGHRMLTTKDMGVSGANNDRQVPRHRRHRPPRGRRPPPRDARLRRRAARQQHRPDARLLRRQLPRRHPQPVPDRRRPQRPELQRPQPRPRSRPDHSSSSKTAAACRSASTTCGEPSRRPTCRRSMDRFAQEAFEFVSGTQARRAFDVGQEDPHLRDRYGRHNWGQSMSAGPAAGRGRLDVRHGPLRRLGPPLGPANRAMRTTCRWSTRPWPACSTDLDDRGLLETTLVVLCGEFSRTPKMNDGGNGGARRQHGHARPRPLGRLDVLPDGRRRRQGRPGRRLDRPPRHTARYAAGHAVEHPRHDLPRARHRSDAAADRPQRPAGAGARRPDADRGAAGLIGIWSAHGGITSRGRGR